jgi:hypothetical protein
VRPPGFVLIENLGHLSYSSAMLFMVIEHFKDVPAILGRFRAKGRMLPEDVVYQASWVDSVGDRCFQLMEAPDAEAMRPWLVAWDDLVEFEIVPVLTSGEYWSPP